MNKISFADPFADSRPLLKHDAIVHCNTKYNKPWAMRLTGLDGKNFDGEWLTKEYDGYGKSTTIYYDFSPVKGGDLVRLSGGSGKNYYPKVIKVLSISKSEMEYEFLSDVDARKLLPRQEKKQQAKAQPSFQPAIQPTVEIPDALIAQIPVAALAQLLAHIAEPLGMMVVCDDKGWRIQSAVI